MRGVNKYQLLTRSLAEEHFPVGVFPVWAPLRMTFLSTALVGAARETRRHLMMLGPRQWPHLSRSPTWRLAPGIGMGHDGPRDLVSSLSRARLIGIPSAGYLYTGPLLRRWMSAESSAYGNFFGDNPYGEGDQKWGQADGGGEREGGAWSGGAAAQKEWLKRRPDQHLLRRAQAQGLRCELVEYDVSPSEALAAFRAFQRRACRGLQAPAVGLRPREPYRPLAAGSSLAQESVSGEDADGAEQHRDKGFGREGFSSESSYEDDFGLGKSAGEPDDGTAGGEGVRQADARRQRTRRERSASYRDEGRMAYASSDGRLQSLFRPNGSTVAEVFRDYVDERHLTPVYLPFWCFDVEYSAYCAFASLGYPTGRGSELVFRDLSPAERDELPPMALRHSVSRDDPDMQILASFQLSQEVGRGVAAAGLLARARALGDDEAADMRAAATRRQQAGAGTSSSASSSWSPASILRRLGCELSKDSQCPLDASLDSPDMRQGVAWQLASRSLTARQVAAASAELRRRTGAAEVKDVVVRLKVNSRRSSLVYLPAYVANYSYGSRLKRGTTGVIVPQEFTAAIAGTRTPADANGLASPYGIDGYRVIADRHLSPMKVAAAGGAVGSALSYLGLAAYRAFGSPTPIAPPSSRSILAAATNGGADRGGALDLLSLKGAFGDLLQGKITSSGGAAASNPNALSSLSAKASAAASPGLPSVGGAATRKTPDSANGLQTSTRLSADEASSTSSSSPEWIGGDDNSPASYDLSVDGGLLLEGDSATELLASASSLREAAPLDAGLDWETLLTSALTGAARAGGGVANCVAAANVATEVVVFSGIVSAMIAGFWAESFLHNSRLVQYNDLVAADKVFNVEYDRMEAKRLCAVATAVAAAERAAEEYGASEAAKGRGFKSHAEHGSESDPEFSKESSGTSSRSGPHAEQGGGSGGAGPDERSGFGTAHGLPHESAEESRLLWRWRDNEWRKWEGEERWAWSADEKKREAESLFRRQGARRAERRRYFERQVDDARRQASEQVRERRRRQKYGGGKPARRRRRDFLGYYRSLEIDLEVHEDVNDDVVKAAFKAIVHKHHPDKFMQHDPALQQQAHERFQRIQVAYEVLKDAKKRGAYDRGQYSP